MDDRTEISVIGKVGVRAMGRRRKWSCWILERSIPERTLELQQEMREKSAKYIGNSNLILTE